MFGPEAAPRVLNEEQIEAVHDRAMRILEDIGTDIVHEGARDLLKANGQTVEDQRVRWGRAFVEEMVAKASSSFRVQARKPERSITIGGGSAILTNIGGPPYASDLDGGRRTGTIADHDALVKLTQASDLLACVQAGAVEAQDLEVEHRNLDMDYSCLRWSDKPFIAYGTSGPKALDGIRMAEIVFGGRAAIEETPALLGVVNSNSPLLWDTRMVDALMTWAEAGQPVIVTPFLLAGATAPVSVAGALAQQAAEALSGIALAQLVRPGTPVLYGSFFTATDMRTGAPAFGTPESIFGILAGAQIARRYGLPFRGGGGLASSNAVDAQAGAETLMMLWATLLAGTDLVMHAAGWLEGGLTASFEKFAFDLEVLEMFDRLRAGIGLSDEEFALEAIEEVGPGGMFLGAAHTMAHFKEWLFMSPIFQTQDFATWESIGSPTAAQHANARWKQLLESYEDPGLDEAIDEELRTYIEKRKQDPPEPED